MFIIHEHQIKKDELMFNLISLIKLQLIKESKEIEKQKREVITHLSF